MGLWPIFTARTARQHPWEGLGGVGHAPNGALPSTEVVEGHVGPRGGKYRQLRRHEPPKPPLIMCLGGNGGPAHMRMEQYAMPQESPRASMEPHGKPQPVQT